MDKIIDVDIHDLIKKHNSFNKIFVHSNPINLDHFFSRGMSKDEFTQYTKDLQESRMYQDEELSFDYKLSNTLGAFSDEKKKGIYANHIAVTDISHSIDSVFIRVKNGDITKFRIKVKLLNTHKGKKLKESIDDSKIALRVKQSEIIGFDFIK